MTQPHSALPAWAAVEGQARELGGAHLRDLDAADPRRWQNLHLENGDWLLHYSRQRVTADARAPDRARARGGPGGAHRGMFRGDPINTTERRAVLHTALRSDFAGSAAIQADCCIRPRLGASRRRHHQWIPGCTGSARSRATRPRI